MIILWILAAVAALWVLKCLFLISKRLVLLFKINKTVKESYGSLAYLKRPFCSVFFHDSKPDFCIRLKNKKVLVTIITTPFRRIRYHFNQNEALELVHERRGTFVTNARCANPTASMDRSRIIRKYPIVFSAEQEIKDEERYVILHPAPRSVTKADGASLVPLHDNDILFENTRICGLQYFLSHIINDAPHK